MSRLGPIPVLLVALALALPGLGGCAQQMAVEGRSDRLYAEAKGALLSEGFRPMGRTTKVLGAQGSDPRAGRLQFLYYGDTVSPTVVEVQITASEDPDTAVAAAPAPQPAPSALSGAHQVIVRAWSSLTFAPDPFIADLAMGVLRRAYSLAGNAP